MRVTVTFDVAPEYADPSDPTGLTLAGYEALLRALSSAVAESIVDGPCAVPAE